MKCSCPTSVYVGKYLLRYRAKHELTQAQLAAKIQVTRGFISQLERGSRTMSLRVFVRTCRALRVRPGKLLRS